jgi:translation initiation factor 1A
VLFMDNKSEDVNIRLPMPKRNKNEFFAVVDKRLGGSRLNVSCDDGKSRMARIPGSKRRKIKRLRIGDLLIVKPWDIQDEKADVLFSYRQNQAKFLSRINKIPDVIDIF